MHLTSFIDSRKRLLTAGRDSYWQPHGHQSWLNLLIYFYQRHIFFREISVVFVSRSSQPDLHQLLSRQSLSSLEDSLKTEFVIWIFLIAPQEHWCLFNNIAFGVTLSRFEVSPSNKMLFNYKAGWTPQDTLVSILTLVNILCLKHNTAYCSLSQQSSKSFVG